MTILGKCRTLYLNNRALDLLIGDPVKSALLYAVVISIVLMALVVCWREPDSSNATVEVASGKNPNASVRGTVTYRERLTLSSGASLETRTETPILPKSSFF